MFRHVTTSVTSARRVEASTVAAAITCRSCRSGRNRHREAVGRGGYGFRERRGPRPPPSASRRPARKDAPVLRAAVGPPAVARSGDVRDRRARRLRDLPPLTDRLRAPCPAPPVSLLRLRPTRVDGVGETLPQETSSPTLIHQKQVCGRAPLNGKPVLWSQYSR